MGGEKEAKICHATKTYFDQIAAKNFIELCFDNIPVKIVMELMR